MSNEELISLAKRVAGQAEPVKPAEMPAPKAEQAEQVKPAEVVTVESVADPLGWDKTSSAEAGKKGKTAALVRWRVADDQPVHQLIRRIEGAIAFPALGKVVRLEALPGTHGKPPCVRVLPMATAYCHLCGAMSVVSVISAVREAKRAGATGSACSVILQQGVCPVCGGRAMVTDIVPGDPRNRKQARRVADLLKGRKAPHLAIQEDELAKLVAWFDQNEVTRGAELPALLAIRPGSPEVPAGWERYLGVMQRHNSTMAVWAPGVPGSIYLPSPKAAKGELDYEEFLECLGPKVEAEVNDADDWL